MWAFKRILGIGQLAFALIVLTGNVIYLVKHGHTLDQSNPIMNAFVLVWFAANALTAYWLLKSEEKHAEPPYEQNQFPTGGYNYWR